VTPVCRSHQHGISVVTIKDFIHTFVGYAYLSPERLVLASRKKLWLSDAAQLSLPDSNPTIESQDLRERRRNNVRQDRANFVIALESMSDERMGESRDS
jgi:hypothetical protein